MEFKFEFGNKVALQGSDEKGVVIGLACYDTGVKQALVRYKSGDGRLVENWWYEDVLKLDE